MSDNLITNLVDGLASILDRHGKFMRKDESECVTCTMDALRESAPRVFSAQEVFAPDFDGVVYIEAFNVITTAIITVKTHNTSLGIERWVSTRYLGGAWMHQYMYGISWRCWNKCPSDELRKETPFESESEG